MSAEEVFALVIISALLLAGLYLFFCSILRTLPRVVWVSGTPTSPIRSLAIGLVEVTGRVKEDKTTVSPATGLDCCLTRYKKQKLQVHYTKNGRTTSWRTIGSGFFCTPFFLQDEEDNRVSVDPKGAELHIPWETYYPHSEFGLSGSEPGSIRYLEQAIYPHSLLYVLGEVKKKTRFADLRGEVSANLAVLRGDPEKMAGLDENRDGQIDIIEWEKAVRKVESQVTEETITAAKNPLDTLVIARPSARRPFIISTHSEKTVISRLRWKGYFILFVGLVLVFFNLAGITGYTFRQPPFGEKYYEMIKLIVER